jgi:PEP-CTERM motif-containing protein
MTSTKIIRGSFIAAVVCLLATTAAQATPFDYTFVATGGGTINGVAFSGPFTFVLSGDTSSVVASGGEFFLSDIGGTFTEGGSTYTLAPTIDLVSNPDPSFPRVAFFDSDFTNGLGLNNDTLAGYELATAVGPLTAPNSSDPSSFLEPTLGGTTGFLMDGGADRLILTSNDSLTFTAGPPSAVPEPSTIALLATGLVGIGLIYRRSGRSAVFQGNSIL